MHASRPISLLQTTPIFYIYFGYEWGKKKTDDKLLFFIVVAFNISELMFFHPKIHFFFQVDSSICII